MVLVAEPTKIFREEDQIAFTRDNVKSILFSVEGQQTNSEFFTDICKKTARNVAVAGGGELKTKEVPFVLAEQPSDEQYPPKD